MDNAIVSLIDSSAARATMLQISEGDLQMQELKRIYASLLTHIPSVFPTNSSIKSHSVSSADNLPSSSR